MSEDEKKEPDGPADDNIPALFATIHYRSEHRPNGYTNEQIREFNEVANRKKKPKNEG